MPLTHGALHRLPAVADQMHIAELHGPHPVQVLLLAARLLHGQQHVRVLRGRPVPAGTVSRAHQEPTHTAVHPRAGHRLIRTRNHRVVPAAVLVILPPGLQAAVPAAVLVTLPPGLQEAVPAAAVPVAVRTADHAVQVAAGQGAVHTAAVQGAVAAHHEALHRVRAAGLAAAHREVPRAPHARADNRYHT